MASKKSAFKSSASATAQKKKKREQEQRSSEQKNTTQKNTTLSANANGRETQEQRSSAGSSRMSAQQRLRSRISMPTVEARNTAFQAPSTRRGSAGRGNTGGTRRNLSANSSQESQETPDYGQQARERQQYYAQRRAAFEEREAQRTDKSDYILPINLDKGYIDSFLSDVDDYVNGASDRLGGIRPSYQTRNSTYESLTASSEDLRGRSINIRTYLNTHKNELDPSYYEEMLSYLDNIDEYTRSIDRRAKTFNDVSDKTSTDNEFAAQIRDIDYGRQFQTMISSPDQSEIERLRNYANTAWEQGDDRAAMEYEDQINWLSQNTTGGRMWRYEQNNARIEEIQKQIADLDKRYRPDETGVINAAQEQERQNLVNELNNLQTWNRQYERNSEWGIDVTNVARRVDDFNEYSHADSYGDPNLDEIEADRAQVYGIADQEGNVYIDDGSFTNMTPVLDGGPSPSPTTLRDFKDPLGAYLSWSDEQKSQYVQQPNTSYGAVADAGTSGNWDFINDNELAVYYYYLNKDNVESAQAYLRSLDGTLLDRAKNQLAEDIQNASAGELFIRNVISVPQQVVGGAAAFGGAIGNALRGEGFRSGNAGMWQFAAGQTRAETAGRIDDATGNKTLLGISLGDAYQAGMSALDSMLGAKLSGGAYTVFMGMGAAAQKAEEAYLSGASDQEIVSTALIAGALEYLSEKIAWEKLIGTPAAKTKVQAVFRGLEQAGFEGAEEVVSSVGNNIADLLIMGDRSSFETTKRQLLAENPGMSDSDASFEALKLSLGDLWKDFVGGFISGFGMGMADSFLGVYSGEGYKQYRDAYKQAGLSLENSGATDAVIANARVTAQEKTAAQDKQNARDVKRSQGELARSADRAQNQTKRAREVRDAAQRSGIADSNMSNPYAAAAADYFNQKRAQYRANRAAVEVGRTVQLTSDTMDALNLVDADNAKARDVRFFQGLIGISPAQAAQNAATAQAGAQGLDYIADESKRTLAASDDGRTRNKQTGDEITIDGVADVKNGELLLSTKEGDILPANLITYKNADEALVYETLQRMNVSKASAIALSEAYGAGKISGVEYSLGMQQAYNFGRIGADIDKAISLSGSFAANLTDQQRNTAYRMGQIDAQTSFDAQQSAIDTRVANAAKSADVKIGKVIYEFDNSGFRMNEQQRQGVQIAKMVSALTGADVHLYESYERDGTRYYKDASGNEAVAPNGFYSNGSVWVDVNAGNNGQGIVGVTLSHEFTHFIQEWSPEKFKVLGDYVIRRFNESNVNVDALVRAQMEKAKRARGEVLSYDEAYAEVVADSMEQMFTGEKSQALEQLAELKKQDATLWGKIKEWFKRIAKRLTAIRKAYSDVDADNETAAVVRGIDNFVEQASKIFAEGLDEAGKNYMAAGDTATDSAVRRSPRNSVKQGYDYTKSFAEQVDDWMNGLLPQGDDLLIGKTPDVFQKIGFSSLPVTIDQTHLDYMVNGTYPGGKVSVLGHTFSLSEIKKLPSYLENPIAIIESTSPGNEDSSVVALVDMKAKNGEQVIVPFRISSTRTLNGEKFDVNIVSSVHSRKNAVTTLLANAIKKENANGVGVYYWQKGKARSIFGRAGVQFPGGSVDDGLIHSIFDAGSPVNRKFQEQTETMQFKRWFGRSKAVDSDGNPLVLYHQTDAAFNTFDPQHPGAGQYDSLMPHGISMKTTDANIGVSGNIQMPLFASVKNPLNVNDRTALKQWYEKNVPGYASAVRAISRIDAQYETKYNAEKKSGADVSTILDDWNNAVNNASVAAKAILDSYFNQSKYDGIHIRKDGQNVETWIAFEGSQVKSADGSNVGTFFSDTDNIYYSARDYGDVKDEFDGDGNVEQTRDLIAVHNLTADELMKTLEMEGFPMPSIAVIRANAGHSRYGDISVIFDKATIDPAQSRYNKIYGGDAWTPMFPGIEYETSSKMVDQIREKYYSIPAGTRREAARPLYRLYSDAESFLNRYGGEKGLIEHYADDTDMMQAYLADSGKTPVETIQKQTVTRLDADDIKLYDYLSDKLGKDIFSDMRAKNGESPITAQKAWIAEHGSAFKDAYAQYLTENGLSKADAQSVINDQPMSFFISTAIKVRNYLANGAEKITTEPDYEATEAAIRKAVDPKTYENWLHGLLGGIEKGRGIRNNKSLFTDAGNRRSFKSLHYEVSLENIVRAMRGENEKGGAMFAATGLFGVATKDYGSIDQVRADKGRLTQLDEDAYTQMKREYQNRFSDIAMTIMDKSDRNSFIAMEDATDALLEAVRRGKTQAGMRRILSEYKHLNIQPDTAQQLYDLVQEIAQMPTEYFEAKPRRAVGLEEIAYVVLPDNADAQLKAALDERNIPTLEYKAGDEADRARVLNGEETKSVRFSLRDTSSVDIATVEKENAQLREANEELRKQFKRTVGVQLDQKAIRKMARDLLKQYDSSYDVDTLTDNLSKVFDVVANGGLTWDEASSAIVDMCRKVLEESSSFDTGLYEYDQPVRDYLKNVRLEISDDMRGGIELVADNGAAYRRGLFGIVGVAKKGSGVSIDQMWSEASEMFPAYFSEDIVNPEDQAERLYYLAQSLKRSNYFTNVYEQNIDAAAYDMMLQIGAKYLDVPQSKTFADKFAEKLEAAREASRDAIRKKAAELRAQQKTANRTEKRLDAKITQMAKVMAQIEARADSYETQLKTERKAAEARVKKIRSENAQEKQRLAEEYRQKNKEKLAELRENYSRDKLTRQISDSLGSIRKLFENGRGTANVKQGMRDTVQATLSAAEVLFSPDVKDSDLILNSQIPVSQDEQALIQRYRMLSRARGNYLDLVDRGIDVDANSKLAAKAQREMLKLNKQLTALGTLERMRDAIFSQRVDSALEALADAYALLDTSADGYISSAYDQDVADYLRDLKTQLKGQIIANMDNDQLKALRNGFKMVLHTIREQNSAFVSDRRETVVQRSTDTMDEVTVANPDRQTKNTTLAGIRKALGWDNLKPFYAFERMQSPTLMRLFQNVRAGEDVWVVDVNEARDYFRNHARQYGYFDIDGDKRFTFTDKSGKAFELSIPQMMSLYAYSKRAAAMQHLENGGFIFDDTARVTDQKGKTKKNVAYNIKQAHVIDQSIVQDVVSKLQKQNAGYLTFVDQMQSYLSKTMGAKGNEVSMKLYGVEMFGEAFYFPIIAPGDNGSKPIVVNDTFKIKNSGFTQALNPNAVGTIVLSDFMDVWAKHINDMAMYHAFTLPLEDMNRVMNYRVRNENGVVTDSVRMRLTNAFTSDAVNYINQFMTDINNGIRSDNRETFVKRMLSGFKKAKVFVNASVVIQQYSAIVRALDVIDAKYFVGVDKQGIGKKWDEVKRFAPIAAVKEMGHFDTGISGSTEEYIKQRSYQGIGENVKAFFTDSAQTEAALSFAPEFADKIAWTQIWSACKRKAADLNPNLSDDALLQKAGEYFTEAIVRTQVYDSTLSKSGLMRSKSVFLNMATAFMAEPTTTLNMLQHSLSDMKRGKPRAALRTVGSVFGSVMLNALLASIVFAARDDDEDKTYLEKYFAAVTSDFLDGINPLTMAPIVKDAWSLLQGYDVERSDMTLMSDTTSRIKSLVQTLSNLDPKAEGKELEEQNRELRNQAISTATAVANLFGLPFDNIVRDIRALFNTFGNTVPIKDTNGEMIRDSVLSELQNQIPVWNWLNDAESTSDKLYDAIRDGNAEYFARLTRGYEKDSQTNSAIQRALKENEDRITEAAKARMEGRINDYKALVRQMVSEYGLAHAGETTVQDNIVKAINAVIRELENKPSDDSYKPTKQLKMDDYVTAMANGREKDANTARETIIQEMVDYDGKTQDKAEESFVSSAVSAARSRCEDGEISEQTAIRIIMDAKDCSKSDARYTMTMWELQRKNPDVSNGRIEKWYNDVKSSGISLAVYNDYAVRMAECKGVDSDGDGKADPNTAKDQKLAVIDSLPISNEQKDFLYRLNNWAESKLYQAPWH